MVQLMPVPSQNSIISCLVVVVAVAVAVVVVVVVVIVHREPKKTRHLTLAYDFTKYWPIFKILSLLDSVGNW